MDIKELIRDKTCYIISSDLKHEILNYLTDNKLLLDIHFFSLSELKEKVFFKYDNEAIYQVSKQFNLSYDNSKLMINNLYYLMYAYAINEEKIIYLKQIKNFLDEKKLLKYDYGFLDYLKNYNIISDLSLDNEFLYKINELLDDKIEFLANKAKENTSVLEFQDSDEEITYLANEIGKLLEKGITPEAIHIINLSGEYLPYIDKIFTLYNIPYHINNETTLYQTNIIKKIYNSYINKEEIEHYNSQYLSQFINIVNDLYFIENQQDKNDFLLYLLKNTKLKNETYENIIKISNIESTYLNNHYYFFIGLNNKVFPSYKKDEDYLSDSIKAKLGYLTSVESNRLKKEYSLNKLKSNANLIISYRLNDYFNSYLKSDLVDLITNNPIKARNENKYSREYDKLQLARELDDFYKYNKKSELLFELLNKIEKNHYKTYDNSYTPIDREAYFKTINNRVSISYSSFEKFNQCKYKYYLDTILKEKHDSFTTYIGTLFHHVLEKIYDANFDFNESVVGFASEYTPTNKEILLLNNLLEDFKEKVKIIQNQYHKSNFKNVKKEQRISIKQKNNLSIDINGYIDKIMLDNENNCYIVDYKTGDTKLTLDYLDYGLKCQLPFYFYLLHKSEEYANVFLVGCYLQIINFKIKNHKDSTKELLLEGLSINDANIIEKIDNFYQNESFIKGIKPNKKGLGTYARTFDNADFDNIINTMDINIKKMINDIDNVNFEINPKLLKNKETTCLYCNYKDICYKEFKNYIDIRKGEQDELD